MNAASQIQQQTAAGLQERFNEHRAVCRKCFAHCVSSIQEKDALCDFGQALQADYLAAYEREAPA